MTREQASGDKSWILYAGINFALLAGVLAVGLVSLFASLEIALIIGAQLIGQSMGDTVQGKYAFALLRNVWLILGGIVFLVLIIYCINDYFKCWREARARRFYLKLLLVEALIVLAAQALAAI